MKSPYCSSTLPRLAVKTTLDELITRLRVLQVQGAGELPVLIETRNPEGAVIFGSANARLDTVIRIEGGLREAGTAQGVPVRVIRVG